MSEVQRYDDAVRIIKTAILQSQYDAAKSVNEKQLMLYYGIGKYISMNSRKGFWGKGQSTLSANGWRRNCLGSKVFLPEAYGICVLFMKNGYPWTTVLLHCRTMTH